MSSKTEDVKTSDATKIDEEAKLHKERAELVTEAKLLGIKLPRLSIAGLGTKDLKVVANEELRQKKQFNRLVRAAITKHKTAAKMKPIDKRKALLLGRFKAAQTRIRANTYSDKNMKAWIEELNVINSNPKAWIASTKNGKLPFAPGNKKNRSALEILDGMDLEE